MSLPSNRRPSAGSRRRHAASSSTRLSHGDSSVRSSYSTASCKCTESNTAPRSNPATPRQQVKYAACSENHGIRPPAPEQYLTPLQQKEVCIRHLRARLKENVERLQDRDSEIEELRVQLTQMQEDWIEEECHRIEAQLALKEAQKEIQQLQQAVEAVKSNLGIPESEQQDCKFEGLGVRRIGPQIGASRSCGCSPAHTMNRSATFTRLSSETSPGTTDRNGNIHSKRYISPNRGAVTLPRGDGQTHLLLEAALLPEQLQHAQISPFLSQSSTCERLCSGKTILPVSRSCHAVNSNCSCGPHTFLPHHHLFLHLPQDEAPPPPTQSPVPPSTSEVGDRPGYRSQACSPTITLISEEGGDRELSIITSTTCAQNVMLSEPQMIPSSSAITSHYITEPLPLDKTVEFTSSTITSTVLAKPRVQQPCPRVSPSLEPPSSQEAASVTVNDEDGASGSCSTKEEAESASPQRSHWSRYFLIDLLAVAVPVVPTLAWLCRGSRNEGMPMYNMGSLLRGCCAVALHSLRRVDRGRGRDPSGTGRAKPI